MIVDGILKTKGAAVKMVRADESVQELAKKLRDERIGAMIVSNDGRTVEGIISERDIAYALGVLGPDLASVPVSQLMTKAVVTCSPRDSISDVMELMTQRRVRHLPVKSGERLVGIISIGDVLKYRMGEMQMEANVLREYAIARR